MNGGGKDLTEGPIGSNLLLFALPTLATSLVQSLNASINAIWVGRLLGEEALAATANAHLIMGLLYSFVLGFGMAAMILVGQAFGRGNLDEARRVLGTAVGGFLPLVTALAATGWLTAPALLRLMMTPEPSFPLALAYLRMIFVALPAGMMIIMLMGTLRGAGDAVTPLRFMVLLVIIDVVLNPVFILGLGPAPRLGIAGSSTAAAIACYVSLVAMVAYIYWRRFPLRLEWTELRYLRPDATWLHPILTKGFPMGLQMIVMALSALAMIGLVNSHGVTTTAAFAVVQQVWNYVQMPAMAVGAAVTAMAAQNIGDGRWDRVGQITRIGIVQSLLITACLILLLTVAGRLVFALFIGGDSPAVPVAGHIHLLATWNLAAFGVMMVLFGTVRANGAVWAPLMILAIGLLPVRFGYIYATQSWLGADALWTSFPVASLVSLALAVAYYVSGSWTKAQMRTPPAPSQ